MPPLLVFGSANIDHVYSVERFVRPGESLMARSYARHAGGKGLNQALAARRAGVDVAFAGCIGPDGEWLRDLLQKEGVDVHWLQTVTTPTGQAGIQVDAKAENAIVIYQGSNSEVSAERVQEVLGNLPAGAWLLAQNEISAGEELLNEAARSGLNLVLNPAPLSAALASMPLRNAAALVVNQVEGAYLSEASEPRAILESLARRCPKSHVVLTLGSRGVAARSASGNRLEIAAERVDPVDTTGAGDAFAGYLAASLSRGDSFETALRRANRAGALATTRKGAADGIPFAKEVDRA